VQPEQRRNSTGIVGDYCLTGRNWIDIHGRLLGGPEQRIKPPVPARICPEYARPLFELVIRVLDIGSSLEAVRCLFARFITVDLGGNHDVAEGDVLNSTCDSNEGGNFWIKVRERADRNRRGSGIARAHFGDCNSPAIKPTRLEPSVHNALTAPIDQVTEYGFGLWLDRSQNHHYSR
jgi:hypothetical protein